MYRIYLQNSPFNPYRARISDNSPAPPHMHRHTEVIRGSPLNPTPTHSSGVSLSTVRSQPTLDLLREDSAIRLVGDSVLSFEFVDSLSVSETQPSILIIPTIRASFTHFRVIIEFLRIVPEAYYSDLIFFRVWCLDIRERSRIPCQPIRRQSFIPVAFISGKRQQVTRESDSQPH